MRKRELEKFQKVLDAQRDELMGRAQAALTGDIHLDPDDFPDEIDTASSEVGPFSSGRLGRAVTSRHRLLEASRITRRGDDGRLLLDRLDLALIAGERLVLSGPSGAGKSQLLRALALLDPLESGEVLWEGSPVADEDVPKFRSRVIYQQQAPALFEGTVEENLRRPFALGTNRCRGVWSVNAEKLHID